MIQADENEVGQKLDSCLAVFDAVCLITNGISITNTRDFASIFNENNEFKEVCVSLQGLRDCADQTCITTRRRILINQLHRPIQNSFLPDPSIYQVFLNKIDSFSDVISSWFDRRLDVPKIALNSSVPGRDLYSDGANSGIDFSCFEPLAAIVTILSLLF